MKEERDIWLGLNEKGEKLRSGDKQLPAKNIAEHVYRFDGLKTDRRGFLKSISLATASLGLASACSQSPVKKGQALFPNSSTTNPGQEHFYASTCSICAATCPLLVKTTDNRPIKIEGNATSEMTEGGICPSAHASLLDLYKRERVQHALKNHTKSTWNEVDSQIIPQLEQISASKKEIAFLLKSSISYASKKLLLEFRKKYPTTRFYYSDYFYPEQSIKLYKQLIGKALLPDFNLRRARLIVSFQADFLSSWRNPVAYTTAYMKNRDIDTYKKLSYHVHFESNMSGTGAAADHRYRIQPGEEQSILQVLLKCIQQKVLTNKESTYRSKYKLEKLAKKLMANKGRSLIFSATDTKEIQLLILYINKELGNIGRSVNWQTPFMEEISYAGQIQELFTKIKQKKVGALFCWDANILSAPEVSASVKNITLKVSFNLFPDTFSSFADFHCPDNHFLESWDLFKKHGQWQIQQPVINPLFNTRQFQDRLLRWMKSDTDWYAYLQKLIKETESSTHTGIFRQLQREGILKASPSKIKASTWQKLPSITFQEEKTDSSNKLEIIFEESAWLKSGSNYPNEFLAEFGDRISKTCWLPYAKISPETAKNKNIQDGQIIEIGFEQTICRLGCVVQAGLADETLVLPLGKMLDAQTHIASLYAYIKLKGSQDNIRILFTTERMEVIRPPFKASINQDALLPVLSIDSYHQKSNPVKEKEELSRALATKREFKPHHWAMVIDLQRCTACGSCVLSCQLENNIPVVGPEEIQKGRSMQWMNIHSFYEGDPKAPLLHFLPVFCQHCDQAPCESVCPVGAVSSSSEGINQQNYSRCIGARFCATNCPYLARTFNYQPYTSNNPKASYMQEFPGRLMLNPEVSVREQGTAEKCSFCIQRIQNAKAKAKKENTQLHEGMLQTACQQSCPASAIYFGDLNDHSSQVYQLSKSKRAFRLLDDLHTQTSVFYLAKVKNTNMQL
jgi:Fe-S-cluster-containing dehydrogenase component